jgi:UDP-2,3-diacylglucosamine pyrophosphatase LpxH
MILVVSDIHLGYENCNKKDFGDFLDNIKNIELDHLVLLGDLFDFWRHNESEIIIDNKDILEKFDNLKAKKIHYVIGNHDYYMLKLNERYNEKYPFEVKKFLRLQDGSNEFYFIHGYEFEVFSSEIVEMSLETYEMISENMCFNGDIVGGVESHFWDIFQRSERELKNLKLKNPTERLNLLDENNIIDKSNKTYQLAISEGKHYLLGNKPNETLIFGHTHVPFINEEKKVANTGSWVNELPNKEFQNSYIEIKNGKMELKYWQSKPNP